MSVSPQKRSPLSDKAIVFAGKLIYAGKVDATFISERLGSWVYVFRAILLRRFQREA
jgi:hypothetical protein